MFTGQSSQQKGINSTFSLLSPVHSSQGVSQYSGPNSTPAVPYGNHPPSSAQHSQPQTYNEFAYRQQFTPDSPKYTVGEDGVLRSGWTQLTQEDPEKSFLPPFFTGYGSGRGSGSEIGSPRRELENPFARPVAYSSSPTSFGATSHFGQNEVIPRAEPISTRSSTSLAPQKKDPPPTTSLFDIAGLSDDRTPPRTELSGFMPLDFDKGYTRERTVPQQEDSFVSLQRSVGGPSTSYNFDLSSSSQARGQVDGASSNTVPTTVTVFGFPPELASQLLTQFATHGQLVSYQPSPDGGNWMDITYPDRWSAQKALAWNGKIIAGRWMVGVSLREGSRGLGEVSMNDSASSTRGIPAMPSRSDSSSFSTAFSSRPTSAPAGPQRIHVDQSGDVFRRAPGVGAGPSKIGNGFVGTGLESSSSSNGLWGKAMDVIFGW